MPVRCREVISGLSYLPVLPAGLFLGSLGGCFSTDMATSSGSSSAEPVLAGPLSALWLISTCWSVSAT